MGSVKDVRRLVESLRHEVEQLRAERIELLAQLRFATEQANRETIEAAWLEKELCFAREAAVAGGREQCGETTAVLPAPWLKALTSRARRRRSDDTLVDCVICVE